MRQGIPETMRFSESIHQYGRDVRTAFCVNVYVMPSRTSGKVRDELLKRDEHKVGPKVMVMISTHIPAHPYIIGAIYIGQALVHRISVLAVLVTEPCEMRHSTRHKVTRRQSRNPPSLTFVPFCRSFRWSFFTMNLRFLLTTFSISSALASDSSTTKRQNEVPDGITTSPCAQISVAIAANSAVCK